jgi:hypothetical protein
LIKSVGKSEHGCYDHKTSRNMTCCAEMREIFVWGKGVVVCRWGELGLGRRRRNRGGEGRQRGHILTFSHGFSNGFSVGDSDRKINTSPYGSAISNPSVIPSAF